MLYFLKYSVRFHLWPIQFQVCWLADPWSALLYSPFIPHGWQNHICQDKTTYSLWWVAYLSHPLTQISTLPFILNVYTLQHYISWEVVPTTPLAQRCTYTYWEIFATVVLNLLYVFNRLSPPHPTSGIYTPHLLIIHCMDCFLPFGSSNNMKYPIVSGRLYPQTPLL